MSFKSPAADATPHRTFDWLQFSLCTLLLPLCKSFRQHSVRCLQHCDPFDSLSLSHCPILDMQRFHLNLASSLFGSLQMPALALNHSAKLHTIRTTISNLAFLVFFSLSTVFSETLGFGFSSLRVVPCNAIVYLSAEDNLYVHQSDWLICSLR